MEFIPAYYLLIGGAMAWLCGVRKPLAAAICVIGWPVIAAIVLIDIMTGREG